MTRDAYADRCEDLFALGGFREARKAAEAGLAELGPDPVLHRWLGLAHAAEDDDDHDADAEAAYEAGLAQWPDDLGLLVSYLELCLRADTWSYPGRAARVERLKERIAVLAPAGSPEAARVDAALGWAGRGYWQDVRRRTAAATADRAAATSHGDDVAEALARGGGRTPAHPEDLRAVEVAAALELLDGPGRALLRLVVRHRAAAYATALVLAIATNYALVLSGTVSYSVWGWIWFVPLLLAESRLRQARRLARERVIAATEARHAGAPGADQVPAG
ncbi:hypothetical protein HXS80_29455 [Streptomyces sp. CB04723]|uniref:hypothetical protein n=1 Tax=Streptomyces TaxID=1883 RepID=UPI0015C497D9|nr:MULTISPECIES: hypothetical protein [Streptomyces]MCF3166932.1 hypothetical protein [Streptomyces violaceoruber]MDW4897272.1 hypothetical protein [Streptomyces californicus]QLG35322.1 hypothetical protein HXS80_29455 [Streptomyces sp. CB04723]